MAREFDEPTLERLRQVAIEKGVDATLIQCRFVPDGADDEEGVDVVARRFTAAEYTSWIDTDSTDSLVINTAIRLVLAIDDIEAPSEGATKAEFTTATKGLAEGVKRLNNLMDGALLQIIRMASVPLGQIDPSDVLSEPIKVSTPRDAVELYGLPVGVFNLRLPPTEGERRAHYPDPGQLRMVKAGDLPGLVIRRPNAEEFGQAFRKTRSAGARDLAFACIVYPSDVAEKRALFERSPALGVTLAPILREMRIGGTRLEKKDMQRNSPA